MEFELEQRYSASIQEVASAYADPEIYEQFTGLAGLDRPEVIERVEDKDSLRQSVRFSFAGGRPSAITDVIDLSRITWVQKSILDRRTNCAEFRIVADQYPDWLDFTGTVCLEKLDDAVVRRTRAQLEVSAPFVGAKAEAMILAFHRELSVAETEKVQQWLDWRRASADTTFVESRPASMSVDPALHDPGSLPPMSDERSSPVSGSGEAPGADPAGSTDSTKGAATPLQVLLNTFATLSGQILEGLIGSISEQLRSSMAGVAGELQRTAQGYSTQLAEQWAHVANALDEELRSSVQVGSTLFEMSGLETDYRESGGEQMSGLRSMLERELSAVATELNSALADMTQQLNAELAQAVASFRPQMTHGDNEGREAGDGGRETDPQDS